MGWSCISIGASKDLYDLLIFHENNEKIMQLPCASNVKKINLFKGGMAKIIGKTVTKNDIAARKRVYELLSVAFKRMPYLLAEFKIAVWKINLISEQFYKSLQSGAIFQKYLRQYSHWTYTDP